MRVLLTPFLLVGLLGAATAEWDRIEMSGTCSSFQETSCVHQLRPVSNPLWALRVGARTLERAAGAGRRQEQPTPDT